MIALIVVALGAVAAAVGSGVLAAQSTRRSRVYFVAWTVALFGLAIGLGATTLGYLAGFGGLIFRAMELGAQLIAPLGLSLALVEIVARGLGARFAMRLAVAAISVIAVVVLGTDPVNPNITFSTTWPDPAIYYQIAPLTVLGFIALFTAATALAAVAVVLVRSRREQLPQTDRSCVLYLAAAAFFVVLPSLVWLVHKSLGVALPLPDKDVFAGFSALAAGLTWYAARVAGDRDLSRAQPGPTPRTRADDEWDEDKRSSYRRSDRSGYDGYETGEFDEFGVGARVGGDRRHAGDYRTGDLHAGDFHTGDFHQSDFRAGDDYSGDRRYEEPDSEIRYPGLAELAVGPGQADEPDDPDRYEESDDFPHTGQFDDLSRFEDGGRYVGAERYRETAPYRGPKPYDEPGAFDQPELSGDDSHAGLFGQITIYTLVEGRADDFDQLTEWVVALVRAKEPDTLVYIVHAVPTAPLQRILYEVYRDRVAHEEHLRRRYVMTYQAEQRPFVFATNVIELGLQHAKVSPLPSISAISDILSESGIDLTGITRSAQPRYEPHPQARYGPPPQPQTQPHPQPQPQYDPPYQGWAEIRGEDSRH